MSVFNLFSDRNMMNSKSTFQAVWRDKDLNPDFANWVGPVPKNESETGCLFCMKTFLFSKWASGGNKSLAYEVKPTVVILLKSNKAR